MKEIIIGDERDLQSKTVITSGDFKYELIPDFCKYPSEEWEYLSVASGFCDEEDNVYLLLRNPAHQIAVFDKNGEYVRDINSGLVGNGVHFGCATPQGTLVIADSDQHCFVEMDKEGKLIRYIGNRGVASDTGYDMMRFKRERRHGSIVSPELRMQDNSAFAAWLYGQSAKVRRGEPFHSPTSAAIDSQGNYIFGDGYGNCAVHKFNKAGELISTWGEPAFTEDGVYLREAGRFMVVHDVAVDSQDRVWALDREGNAVTVYNTDGAIAAYIHGQLGAPSGAWFDGTYMYIGGCGGYISVFDMDFGVAANLGFFNSDIKVHGLAGNSQGDLFLFPTHAAPDHQCMCLKRIC